MIAFRWIDTILRYFIYLFRTVSTVRYVEASKPTMYVWWWLLDSVSLCGVGYGPILTVNLPKKGGGCIKKIALAWGVTFLEPKFAQEHDARASFGHRARVQKPARSRGLRETAGCPRARTHPSKSPRAFSQNSEFRSCMHEF